MQDGDRVLLGKKKAKIGAGYWNGFGGKIEAGETAQEAAKRELVEECGLVAHDCTHVGTIAVQMLERDTRDSRGGMPEGYQLLIYRTTSFSGTVTESSEVTPQWWHVDDIPFDRMWAHDRHWWPLVLTGRSFEMTTVFRGRSMVDFTLRETEATQTA